MKRILIISFSEVKNDPRVYRQIQLLHFHFHITAAGFGACPVEGIDWIGFPFITRSRCERLLNIVNLVTRQFEKYYWNIPLHRVALKLLDGNNFDLVLANDVDVLSLALRIAKNSPVILDAHEYSPREFEDDFLWRLFLQPYKKYLCVKYLHRVKKMFTVSEGLAKEYQRVYGIKPLVLMNTPTYQQLEPSSVSVSAVRMIHHGVAIPSRNLEFMVEMMQFLDSRFQLDLMLIPSDLNYLNHIKSLAAGDIRIRFIEPVAMLDIPRFTNRYDVGVFLLSPVNFNYKHALPNKFFEFVQARLGIAIGPSPEMARLVKLYGLGVVAKNFTPIAMATCLNELTTQDIANFKAASHVVASELCFSKSSELLLGEVSRLME